MAKDSKVMSPATVCQHFEICEQARTLLHGAADARRFLKALIDNELYVQDNTWMLFGDAKAVIGDLVKQLASGSGIH